MKSKKRVVFEFIENTVAYALPVIIQQFILYPMMARKLGAEKNGLFLTMIALNFFVVNLTATVLANTRLLLDEKYKTSKEAGDFNFLLLLFLIIDILVVGVATYIYSGDGISPIEIMLSCFVVSLFLYHDYVYVQYRIDLKFNKIFVNNILLCIGYLLGLALLFTLVPYWQIVFIVPYVMTAIYDTKNTELYKEPYRRTPLFTDTVKQYFILAGSSLLSTAVTYGDRLVLYPLLDGTNVSILVAAQIIGKMMQIISAPASSFVLSYLVKKKDMKIKISLKTVLIISIGCICIYAGCIIVSNPMITILYPQWASDSLQYVKYTAAFGLCHMSVMVLNSLLLRFCDSKWQIVKSTTYFISYLGFSFLLLSIWGLKGFCIGNLLASLVELVLTLAILFKTHIITL